jgi:hypothetical protein
MADYIASTRISEQAFKRLQDAWKNDKMTIFNEDGDSTTKKRFDTFDGWLVDQISKQFGNYIGNVTTPEIEAKQAEIQKHQKELDDLRAQSGAIQVTITQDSVAPESGVATPASPSA